MVVVFIVYSNQTDPKVMLGLLTNCHLYIYKNEHVSTLNVPMFPLCMYVPSSRLVLLMSRCPVYVCPELAGRSWYEMFVCYRMFLGVCGKGCLDVPSSLW